MFSNWEHHKKPSFLRGLFCFLSGLKFILPADMMGLVTEIKRVLTEKPQLQLMIDAVKKENNKLIVSVLAMGTPITGMNDVNLLAAIVQKHVEMSVKAGENRGSKLTHTNVVRTFIKQSIKEKMNFEIEVPGDLENNNWQLILYTQQKNDLKITGATVKDFISIHTL